MVEDEGGGGMLAGVVKVMDGKRVYVMVVVRRNGGDDGFVVGVGVGDDGNRWYISTAEVWKLGWVMDLVVQRRGVGSIVNEKRGNLVG